MQRLAGGACFEAGALRRRLSMRSLCPALCGGVVLARRLDPGAEAAVGEVLALPERRPGLQEIHQESGGLEGSAAMLGGGRDEDDVLAGGDPAEAMEDGDALQRPAALGLGDDALDLGLDHARIVLQLERGETAALV